jgi:RNA polymerase sigma-70 factor, ECF subfamily
VAATLKNKQKSSKTAKIGGISEDFGKHLHLIVQVSRSETLQLLQLTQSDDGTAVEMFVRAHQQPVYRLALSVLDDPAEAEEAAQDALVAAIKSLHTYRGDSAFTTWLYAITLNVCRTRLRKQRSRDRLMDTLKSIFHVGGDLHAHPEDVAIRSQADASVARAVNSLDEKHRLPVVLRYYNEFSIAEIAQLLDISEGTVHSRLFTARERLRGMLRPEHYANAPTRETE